MNSVELLAAGAGLAAATCWAGSSLIFGAVRVSASELNTVKNVLAAVLFGGTLLVLRGSGEGLSTATLSQWGWLAASSVIGLVIGDYAYFRSLQILGPRRALVLTLGAPPLAALTAAAFLSESLLIVQCLGMGVTLVGIAVVILERGVPQESAGHFPGSLLSGLLFGALGALGQATGSVLAKFALVDTSAGLAVAPVEAAGIRLVVAAAFGFGLVVLNRSKPSTWRQIATPSIGGRVAFAALVGTYGGIYLSMVAYAGTEIGVATTMTSLAPVVVIPLVWKFHKVRVSPRAILGSAIAIAGVVVLLGFGAEATEETSSPETEAAETEAASAPRNRDSSPPDRSPGSGPG